MGLTKTPANTASDPESSFLHGTKAGFHDTHDQNVLITPPLKGERMVDKFAGVDRLQKYPRVR